MRTIRGQRLPCEQRADGQRAAQGPDAERGVQEAVTRGVGLDPVVLLSDDRQLTDERERERREEEDRHEATAHDSVGARHPQSGGELTESLVSLCVEVHPGRKTNGQQGGDDHQIGRARCRRTPMRGRRGAGAHRRSRGRSTREAFICAELSEMAAGEVLDERPGSGRSALYAGA